MILTIQKSQGAKTWQGMEQSLLGKLIILLHETKIGI